MKTIGIVGLGKIGLPIALKIIEAGHTVTGYRRSAMDDFVALGGLAGTSPCQTTQSAEIVLVCLPNDDALKASFESANGILAALSPGQIVAVISSHPVNVKKQVSEQVEAKGAVLLDGEVSGTPGMVEDGSAAIYLAGDKAAVETLRPVFGAVSDKFFFLGHFGSATQVKLVNNLLVATHIAGTAQAMAIGLKLGLDPDLLIDAVGRGSGSSTQFKIRAPWMATQAFLPQQGPADALLYYLHSVQKLADELGINPVLVDSLTDIFERAAPDIGERDVAAIIEFFQVPNAGDQKK